MQNMTTKRAYPVRRSRAEWTVEVAQWRKSGLGSAEYAKQRDLKRGTLLWWSRQVGDSNADRKQSAAVTPVKFVPLRVREDQSAAEASIEIILRNGRRVRVSGAVDGGTLSRVLDAAEGAR